MQVSGTWLDGGRPGLESCGNVVPAHVVPVAGLEQTHCDRQRIYYCTRVLSPSVLFCHHGNTHAPDDVIRVRPACPTNCYTSIAEAPAQCPAQLLPSPPARSRSLCGPCCIAVPSLGTHERAQTLDWRTSHNRGTLELLSCCKKCNVQENSQKFQILCAVAKKNVEQKKVLCANLIIIIVT